MSRIPRTDDNLFKLPEGAIITKKGSVYITESNFWVPKDNGKGYTGHERLCIGVIRLDANGEKTNQMYANANFYRRFFPR